MQCLNTRTVQGSARPTLPRVSKPRVVLASASTNGRNGTGIGAHGEGLDEPAELRDGRVLSGPDLSVEVNGMTLPNPFVIGSGEAQALRMLAGARAQISWVGPNPSSQYRLSPLLTRSVSISVPAGPPGTNCKYAARILCGSKAQCFAGKEAASAVARPRRSACPVLTKHPGRTALSSRLGVPPTLADQVMKKAFDEGWGGVICKTLSLDSKKVRSGTEQQASQRS